MGGLQKCETKVTASTGVLVYHQKPLNATESDRHCADAHGARLAVLNTREKFLDALEHMPMSGPCATKKYRIGLLDDVNRDPDVWITGERFKKLFRSQVVRNYDARAFTDDYGLIGRGTIDIWLQNATQKRPFICFKPGSANSGESPCFCPSQSYVIAVLATLLAVLLLVNVAYFTYKKIKDKRKGEADRVRFVGDIGTG